MWSTVIKIDVESNRTESPEINCNVYGLIVNKVPKLYNGKRLVSSTNVVGETSHEYPHGKLNSYLIPYKK